MRKLVIFALLTLTMLVLAKAGAPAVQEISFKYSDGFVLVQARTPQSEKSLTFLLDSGAGASVLDLRCAARLHVPMGEPIHVHGVGSDAVAYRIPNIPAMDGDARVLATISMAVDLSNAAKICETPVDGLLGVDFFKNRIVQIDFATHIIRFLAKADVGANAEKLPIQYRNGMLLVPVSVNGSHDRWTRFDTGCNDALHWVVPRSGDKNVRHGVSIGFITEDQDQTLTSVKLGKRSLDHVETALHGSALFPGEAGLLGNGILSQFTVTIDSIAHRVYLQTPR